MKKTVNVFLTRSAMVQGPLAWAFVVSAVQAADTLPGAPAGVMLSGAACAAGEVVNDAGALGGKVATGGGGYQSLVQAKVPETGDAFTIRVHRKGGPIQLKAVVNGAQKEKEWNWEQPPLYEWCSLGRCSRPDLGEGIVIIRGAKQDRGISRIDCIVFSADAAAHPQGIPVGSENLIVGQFELVRGCAG